MSSLEDRVARLENHFDISDPESFLSKFNKLFNDFQDITDEWQVNMKLTVGEIDPKVVIKDGKVDGRDLSEDGKVLHDNKRNLGEHLTRLDNHDTKLGEHQSNINTNKDMITTVNNTLKLHSNYIDNPNPHHVTAKQVGALPITGGTINGNITARIITATDKISLNKGTISWGKEAWIGISSHIGNDDRPWMHIGGYEKDEQGHPGDRFLALMGNTYISGNLHVKGKIYVSSIEVPDEYTSRNLDNIIGKGKLVALRDQ